MMQLRYNDTAETVKVGGIKYKLKQLHWHSPSEHTINGERLHLHPDGVVHCGLSAVLSVCTHALL
jgi:carbonic anhydrase